MFNFQIGSFLPVSIHNFNFQEKISGFTQNDLFQRIKNIVEKVIEKIIDIGQEIKIKRENANLKTIAIAGFVVLIVILVASIFRRGNLDGGLIPPPTPGPTNKNNQNDFSTPQLKGSVSPNTRRNSEPYLKSTENLSLKPDPKKNLFGKG